MTSSLPFLLACTALLGCAVAPVASVPPPARGAAVEPLAQAPPAVAPAAVPAVQAQRKPATGTFEDARRHLVRGVAAIEMAKTDAELIPAAEEFQLATEISPEWAFAWYNLGNVQSRLGQLQAATVSYKKFLTLAPDDKEAGRVSDELIKLEFRMEKAAQIQGRSGTWFMDLGAAFTATAEGNHLVLRSSRQGLTAQELTANSFWTDYPKPPLREFNLELQGTKVTGSSNRADVVVGKCTVPAELVEVTGTYEEGSGRLLLKMPRSKYKAITQMNIFLDPVGCADLSVIDRSMVDVVFYGPLPGGSIGASVDYTHRPGEILKHTLYDWFGCLKVTQVTAPSTAAAGLLVDDEIMAIDGVLLTTLSAGDAQRRLSGAPGSEVALTVFRRKPTKGNVELRLQRVSANRR